MDEKRFLKFHFPFLNGNEIFPLGYNYTQLYTGLSITDNGKSEQLAMPETIHVPEYQIPEFELYPVFHKPISKFLNFPIDGTTDEG